MRHGATRTPAPRRALACALSVGACLVAAPAADASSIVFVRGGDVWLITPDGGREHRVTSTGGFAHATQADDGTIVATEQRGPVHRMDRNGNDLNPPFSFGTQIIDPDLSPDGARVVYWTAGGCGGTCIAITDSNRATPPSVHDYQSGWFPSWRTNTQAIYVSGGYVRTKGLSVGDQEQWFTDPEDKFPRGSAITPAGDKLAVVWGNSSGSGPYSVSWYTTNGPPPAEPTRRCVADFGGAEPQDPSFAPDGSAIAWEFAEGVQVQPAVDLDSCTQPVGGFTIAGAKSPDWGPADVPTGTTTTTPTPTPTTTDPETGGPLQSALVPRKARIRTVLKKGLRVKVTCSSACNVSGDLRYKRKVVAKGKKALVTGKGTLVLKFTARGKKQLKNLRRAKLAVKVKAADAQKNTSSASGSITLTR